MKIVSRNHFEKRMPPSRCWTEPGHAPTGFHVMTNFATNVVLNIKQGVDQAIDLQGSVLGFYCSKNNPGLPVEELSKIK